MTNRIKIGTTRSIRCGFLLWGIVLFLAPGLPAQPGRAPTTPSNRWLFIVDISHAMQPRSEAISQFTASLVAGGMKGQMRRGDTVGLWTFSDTLSTGEFPLQQWSPGLSQTVASRIYQFLEQEKYEKSSRLDRAMSGVEQLVTNSDFITIILVSDGHEKIHGTPFDDKINAAYQSWQNEQAREQMPILTLLRAAHGVMTDFRIITPQWPLDLPPLPPELAAMPATNVPVSRPASQPAAAPPPATVPPLILHGEKPKPPPPASPAETKANRPAVAEVLPPPTNPPAPPEISAPAPAATAAQPSSGTVASNVPAATSPSPHLPASAATEKSSFVPGLCIGAIGALGVVVLVAIFRRIRRARAARRPSLITRSLEREQE